MTIAGMRYGQGAMAATIANAQIAPILRRESTSSTRPEAGQFRIPIVTQMSPAITDADQSGQERNETSSRLHNQEFASSAMPVQKVIIPRQGPGSLERPGAAPALVDATPVDRSDT